MNIVLIGGGSFVFAPTVLEDVIVKHRLNGCELRLVDPHAEAVEAMAGAGARIAKEIKVDVAVQAYTDRRKALKGADFVIVSASVQGASRWQTDFNILSSLGIADQARECGGVGGLMNTFRSITLLMDVCRDMEELCPQAWVLDVTNPMPRVVTAISRYTSIRTAGFCNIAYRGPEGYSFLAPLVGKAPTEVDIVTGGLNHFAWVLELREKQTGRDLLPELKQYILEGDWMEHDEELRRELGVMRRWLLLYGAVAAGHIDHHAEWLPIQADIHYATTPPYHGTAEERTQRLNEIQAIASGERPWDDLFSHASWEHPVDIAIALNGDKEIAVDILNIPNDGAMAELPVGRIIEVPVKVRKGQMKAEPLPALPEPLAAIIQTLSEVHELAAKAAVTGDLETARRVIEIDPAVTDKQAGYEALNQMLRAHADLLPQFQVEI